MHGNRWEIEFQIEIDPVIASSTHPEGINCVLEVILRFLTHILTLCVIIS